VLIGGPQLSYLPYSTVHRTAISGSDAVRPFLQKGRDTSVHRCLTIYINNSRCGQTISTEH